MEISSTCDRKEALVMYQKLYNASHRLFTRGMFYEFLQVEEKLVRLEKIAFLNLGIDDVQ
jgi:hypothetical protein